MKDSLITAQAILDQGGALDVITLNLAKENALADHMIIASGTSARHVASLAEKLAHKLKEQIKINIRMEGLPAANWVLVDAGDIIIHIFRPEVRDYYQIENLWTDRPNKNKPNKNKPNKNKPNKNKIDKLYPLS